MNYLLIGAVIILFSSFLGFFCESKLKIKCACLYWLLGVLTGFLQCL